MGKADLTRDYYGDLELQPSADAAEIKKQFKKLGKISLVGQCAFATWSFTLHMVCNPSLLGNMLM